MEGQTYKADAAVLCGTIEDDLKILLISKIYIVNNKLLFFKGQTYILANYNRHLRAHILSPTNKEIFVQYDTLIHYIPLHPRVTRVLPHQTIIVLPFYVSH